MAKYKVKAEQNIFDISVHLYGSIEGMFDLLITNPWLNMVEDLKPGQELEYHEGFVVNAGVVRGLKNENLTPINSERHVYAKLPEEELVLISEVNNIFECVELTVGGEGRMLFDWGDNSDIEEVILSHTAQTVEHYFDNKSDERWVKIYGEFQLTKLDTSEFPGPIMPVKPLVVDEYVCKSNSQSLNGLLLFEGTYLVNLYGCYIENLIPIGDMSLQELDLRGVRYKDVSVLDDYLQYIYDNYGDRRSCKVYLDTMPSEKGMAAINKIINEPEWNVGGQWEFVINNLTYK